jgi:hypothetical protein
MAGHPPKVVMWGGKINFLPLRITQKQKCGKVNGWGQGWGFHFKNGFLLLGYWR